MGTWNCYTDSTFVGVVNLDKLSYSSIQRYGYNYEGKLYGCQWSYYLRYIKEIKPCQADQKFAEFGIIVHDILANFYPSIVVGNINNYPNPKAYFNVILNDLLSRKWNYTLSETQYKECVGILDSFSTNESNKWTALNGDKTLFMPLHIELKINGDLNVRIDRINLPDHTMVDYKTNRDFSDSCKIEHILQAGTYAVSYFKKYGIWSPKMVFYFLRHNKPLVINITQEIIDIVSEIINTTTDGINKGVFTKNSDNCTWCDMRHVCGLEETRLF